MSGDVPSSDMAQTVQAAQEALSSLENAFRHVRSYEHDLGKWKDQARSLEVRLHEAEREIRERDELINVMIQDKLSRERRNWGLGGSDNDGDAAPIAADDYSHDLSTVEPGIDTVASECDSDLVFVNQAGRYYHVRRSCTSLTRVLDSDVRVISVDMARVLFWPFPCPVCSGLQV